MPKYLSPGVYVEEIDSGSRPIEGVGTAVAAFIGLAEKGPFNKPTCQQLDTVHHQLRRFRRGRMPGGVGFRRTSRTVAATLHRPDRRRRGRKRRRTPTAASRPHAGHTGQPRVVALDPAPPRSIKVEIDEFQQEGQDGQEGARRH